jgi:amino acid transporter
VKNGARVILVVAAIGFLTNLVWEVAQAPLYGGFISFSRNFFMCLIASIVDAVTILLIYMGFAVYYRDLKWLVRFNWKDVVLVMAVGFLIAVIYEKWALAVEQWSYGSQMPMVPATDIALLPVLQMMLLPPLTFYLTKMIVERNRAKT